MISTLRMYRCGLACGRTWPRFDLAGILKTWRVRGGVQTGDGTGVGTGLWGAAVNSRLLNTGRDCFMDECASEQVPSLPDYSVPRGFSSTRSPSTMQRLSNTSPLPPYRTPLIYRLVRAKCIIRITLQTTSTADFPRPRLAISAPRFRKICTPPSKRSQTTGI